MQYGKFTLIRHNIYYVKHVKTEIIPNNPAKKSVVIAVIERAAVVCDRGVCRCAGDLDARVLIVIINPPKISHHANRSDKAGKN